MSRFSNELLHKGLIYKEYVNPLTRRATSYKLSAGLKEHLDKLQTAKPDVNFSLCVPHKIRYKYKMLDKKKPISLNTSRFAASKVKNTRTWMMVGGLRHHFEYKHPVVGKIGLTVHPNSFEIYQKDRGTPIRSASLEDATAQVAMAIHETAQRFMQEQSWESVTFTLGDPILVSSPHYAFSSKLGRAITDSGQTQLQFTKGFEVDKSLEVKYGDKTTAHLETQDVDAATIVDQGLKNAYNIETIVPALVQQELKSVSDQILGITEQKEKIDLMCNNVQALCTSGLPIQNQLNQLMGVVASQSLQITNMQKILLQVVENMSKIIGNSGAK